MGIINDLLDKIAKGTNEAVETVKETVKKSKVKKCIEEIMAEVALCFGKDVEEKYFENIAKIFLEKQVPTPDGYWEETGDELLKNLIIFKIYDLRKELLKKEIFIEDMDISEVNELIGKINAKSILDLLSISNDKTAKDYLLFLGAVERNKFSKENFYNVLGTNENEYLKHFEKNSLNETLARKLMIEYPENLSLIAEGIHPNIQKSFYDFAKDKTENNLKSIIAVLENRLKELVNKETV